MRYIDNFGELLNQTRIMLPDITFHEDPDYIDSINETAQLYSTIKFLFCPIGSNVFKNVFMRPKSVIVAAIGDSTVVEIITTCVCTGIYFLSMVSPGVSHTGKDFSISIPVALKAIKLGVACSIEGKWKYDSAFYDCEKNQICI